MVCKEEVLLWFKDLDSYTRIDVLYELLNMCLPFELRFIGSCVEELGKHTYQELRGPAITANDLDKLNKDPLLNYGISEETVRHRLLIYLSLLSSRNYDVSDWLYRKLLRTDHIEEYLVKEKGKDDVLHSEFLLLYTMALHHPAFTFEQKQFFSRVLSNLLDFKENRVSAKHSVLGYPPGFGYPTHKSSCPQQQQSVGGTSLSTSKQSPPSSMTCSAAAGGDSSPHPASMAYHHQQPPGLPQLPPMPPNLDFVSAPPPSTAGMPAPPPVWSTRPGFPYGAPPEPPAAVPSSVMVPPPVGVPPAPPPGPPPLEAVAQLTLEQVAQQQQQTPPQFANDVGQMATVEEVEQAVKFNMAKARCHRCEEKCGKGKAHPDIIRTLDAGYKALLLSDSKSLLKKYLTKEVFDKLKTKKTSYGSTLMDCVQSGFANHDSGIGIYAADPDCYTLFADLFDPIIDDYHGGFKKSDQHPHIDFGNVSAFGDLDPKGEYVVSTRVRCCRSFEGYPFNPNLTEAQYCEIEDKMKDIFATFSGELSGSYYPLKGMTKEVQNQLIDDHFLFKEGDRFLQTANACRYWPSGRGIFHNADKTFLVWVNEEDHLRIISLQQGGHLGQVYKRFVDAVQEMQKKVCFMHDERFGFLTFCPTNLGTTIRASVHIKVPKLAANMQRLEEIAGQFNLQVRGTRGEHSQAEGGIYDISNKRRLGLTEFQSIKEMYDGLNCLEEKRVRELMWSQNLHHPQLHPPVPPGDAKPNGVRFPAYIGGGKVRPYLLEQMRALQLDGENSSLHKSSSSRGSSPEITPPSTPKGGQPTVMLPPPPPAAIGATGQPTTATPHGPGRGEKARMNGLPPYGNGQPQPLQQQQPVASAPPLPSVQQPPPVVQPDTSSPPPTQQPPPPPPPATAFGNSSVPYAFQQFAQMPPNSHQQAAQAQQQQHRPPAGAAFTVAQFPSYPENFPPPTFTFPYMPLMYSSPFPARPPGCYNCGSPNHQGSECTGPHIDEITQKKAYQLEYAAAPPTAAQQAPPTAALAGQEAEK
nr:unnamed protein product [Callosobruchus chinensis]